MDTDEAVDAMSNARVAVAVRRALQNGNGHGAAATEEQIRNKLTDLLCEDDLADLELQGLVHRVGIAPNGEHIWDLTEA